MSAIIHNIGKVATKKNAYEFLEEKHSGKVFNGGHGGARKVAVMIQPNRNGWEESSDSRGGENAAKDHEEVGGGEVGRLVLDASDINVNWIINMLRCGVPVFCKQPPMLTNYEARRIAGAAKLYDGVFAINFEYRKIKGMAELREHIRRGELGKLRSLDITFYCGSEWARGENLQKDGDLKSLVIQLVDLTLWLLDFPCVAEAEISQFCDAGLIACMNRPKEYLLARFEIIGGPAVKILFSQRASQNEATIEMEIYGDCGGDSYWKCNDSLLSFAVDRSVEKSPLDCKAGVKVLSDKANVEHISSGYDCAIDNFLCVTELFNRAFEK